MGTLFAFIALAGQTKAPSYSNVIAPIIKKACLSCHTGKDSAAGLDLSTPKAISITKTILAGQADKSVFLRRIKGLDGKPQMPLGFKPLTAPEIKSIEEWITGGAAIDQAKGQHWAYVPPVAYPVPPKTSTWGKNAIDNFTLEKMIQQGYKPSPEASPETLIRRVYLDITGLPPTVEQIDAYLKDKDPGRYEKLVDKLLASPQYGERQARMWLDLSRYADTDGYEADLTRTAYLYRDWLISAFNKNMRYDEFTIEQNAGDMLPNSTLEQKVATGFHRNSQFNQEGGVDPKESFYTMVIDRVTTTSQTWLGSTMQCAQCHNHKYDPFTQKDFFRMYAIFSNGKYEKVGDYSKSFSEKWYEPKVKVPNQSIVQALKKEEDAQKAIQQERQQLLTANKAEFDEWKTAIGQPQQYVDVKFDSLVSTAGAKIEQDGEGTINVTGTNPDKDEYVLTSKGNWDNVTAIQIETRPNEQFGSGRSGSQNFVLTSVDVSVDDVKRKLSIGRASFVQDLFSIDGLLAGDLNSGWAVHPRGKQSLKAVLVFDKPVSGQNVQIKLSFKSPYVTHNLGRFAISTTGAKFPLVSLITKVPTDSNGLAQEFAASTTAGLGINKRLAEARQRVDKIQASVPVAMVLEDKPNPGILKAPVHHRGEFISPGELVDAGVPEFLGKINPGTKANRLSLARWLIDKSNPLTARVQINRMWEQYFGRGIVETLDDFGTQGARPSHAKLLDYLATQFVKNGWDMKAMHRLIATSATYRQSSKTNKFLLEKDPTNVYLARGPRHRMEAEMIRDMYLTASGLLVRKIGGPSVMPFQPDGVWDSPISNERWMETKDEGRFRRGIYVFAKRTAMYPSFMAFDSPSREVCTVRRSRTNTPLQALTLLNDKASIEAAKALGLRLNKFGNLRAGLVYGFRATTGRMPREDEVKVLASTYTKLKEKYGVPSAKLGDLGTNPREAAWTMIGNILLNLDETITKA